jgi:uncharacterized membrane protein YkvA (DUF1232 family)
MLERMKRWALGLKRDVVALWIGARDPRTWYAKALPAAVAAYALSPIDLIPDFIPILGYIDELVLLPFAIALVVWMIPPELMAKHRADAEALTDRPVSRTAAVVIALIWAAAIAGSAWLAWRWYQS